MRPYDLGVILDGDLDEPAAHAWVKQIADMVVRQGGTVVGSADWWGKRRFRYEINHKQEGYYVFFNVVAPGGALDEVERALRLADEVVRHKLMKLPDTEAAKRGMTAAMAAAGE
jgi:small subunit ribosomal protein S6